MATRILAICGSLQAHSNNLSLLETAVRLAPADMSITLSDALRSLPQFDPDLEAEATLAIVDAWREAVAESDALLIACPEYGFSLPGSLKNGIDWLIGSGELENKIVAVTASVPHPERGRRGLRALLDTLGAVSATIVGGEPITRGPNFEADLGALLEATAAEIARRH